MEAEIQRNFLPTGLLSEQLTKARVKPDHVQEVGTKSGSPIRVAGTSGLEPLPAASRAAVPARQTLQWSIWVHGKSCHCPAGDCTAGG